MNNIKQILEQGISKFGVAISDCWDAEHEWYALKRGSAVIFARERMIPIDDSNDFRHMVEFKSPLFELPSTLPEAFYKEVLELNNFMCDGCAFNFSNNFLQIKFSINAAFVTPDFVFETMGNLLYWSDKYDDELMEKYKEFLAK
ncbi:hypothetical protein CHRY9390_00405 [Chryseobacterium aquaeductus]|uniref:Uncharacterized protein n=1 Tax=Chryseobacterium aquaeductus TaxID=2675056 RepID=A0A9N8MEN7_9FLAO|nr:YbjN domain-containing protein [Chryseobacterium aquaeductus]CAA7329762.1 hypothetical protein CHRY9390_00405 [Chryseobacterium potabilaquae]CAD7798904.1 hypothetical protein CHRY9390_00405 [Chryseobacterium aquaeductus]